MSMRTWPRRWEQVVGCVSALPTALALQPVSLFAELVRSDGLEAAKDRNMDKQAALVRQLVFFRGLAVVAGGKA